VVGLSLLEKRVKRRKVVFKYDMMGYVLAWGF
jgi:hypothetical protein